MINDMTNVEVSCVSGGYDCTCSVTGGNTSSLSILAGEINGAIISAYAINRYFNGVANNLLNNQGIDIPPARVVGVVYGSICTGLALFKYVLSGSSLGCECKVS